MGTLITDTVINQIIQDPYGYGNKLSIPKLVKLLKDLSFSYYNEGKSLVPDTIFEILKNLLEERDPTNKFLQEVGSAPISKNKVKLPYPMASLNKIKPDTKMLDDWKLTYPGPYILSDKLDGVSAMFFKSKDNLHLYTRGDANSGQDISFLIPYVINKNIDFKKIPVGTAIRGELVISKKNFEKISDQYKNARNTVAGLVNSKHYSQEVAKLTDFISYSLIFPEYKQSEQMEKLKNWGFPLVTHLIKKDIDNDMLSKYLQAIRTKGQYEIDGIVVVDGSQVYSIQGSNPPYAFAFKMVLTDQVAEATVIDVEWSVSKHGYLKPVIRIEPITLVGVSIKHATAFNAKYVVDNKLGPGAIIKIVRSGDVIPHILEVLKPSTTGKPKMPDVPYKWNKTGIDLIVKDIHGACKDAIIIKQVTSFFSVMGVKFISEGIVTKLVDNGFDSLEKILKAGFDELIKIEGIGEKLVQKIFENIINAFKTTSLEILMAASNEFGRGLGVRRLKLITKIYPNILTVNWSKEYMKEKIIELDGFDELTASQFVDSLPNFKKFFNKLKKIDIIDISHIEKQAKQPVKKVTSNKKLPLEGEKIVFTGFRSKELEDFIVNNGGSVSSSVSGNTTILVHSEGDSSAKYNKALELKITMLTEKEFRNKYKV